MQINLKAQLRDKKDKQLKKENFVPAVVYGPGSENQNLKINKIEFDKVFVQAGESNLIDLSIAENPIIKVLIKAIQRDVVKDHVIHVDLYQVDMTKKITAEVNFNFIGESRAVKELGGALVKNMDSIKIECLPEDLINKIDIDISSLEEFNSSIRISDLNLPENINITSEASDIIANISQPRKAEAGENQEGEGEDGKVDEKEVENKKTEDEKESTKKVEDKK